MEAGTAGGGGIGVEATGRQKSSSLIAFGRYAFLPLALRSRLGRRFQQIDQQSVSALLSVFLLLGLFGFHEIII